VATGLLITGVLAVLVGHTVQTMQVVGWAPITPVTGLTLPFWTGTWLGVFPTWEGLLAQAGAVVFVLGSYVAAEAIRRRRRAKILAVPIAGSTLRPEVRVAVGGEAPRRPGPAPAELSAARAADR
jgi:high-affinity iron transporter